MHEFLLLCLFLVDALLVAISAWLVLCAVGGKTAGLVEPLLGWGLMVISIVAGSGVVLGFMGTLGRTGFLFAHAAVLLFLVGWRRAAWRGDFAAARAWLTELRRFLGEPTGPARAATALVMLVLVLAVLAAGAPPLIHDALAYRLPRIGLWLNEARILHFAAADPRLNYMPWVPDLITAWLLGATGEGWRLVALVQTFGGGLLLVATIALTRQSGLGRLPALGAAALLLGLANVAVQFTTPQTDLFTAGILSAAFGLWQGALLRGGGSLTAGVGVALALGSKGTVFYIAPGLFIIAVYLVFRHRLALAEWRRSLVGLISGTVLFVVPVYAMNHATYGGIFGPAEAVRIHHGESPLEFRERAAKLWLNLRTSALQVLDPHAQPAGLRTTAQAAGNVLLNNLPESEVDRYAFEQYSRRDALRNVMNHPVPDANVLGCGLLAVISFVIATVSLLRSQRRSGTRSLVLAGSTAVVVYVLFQHALVQWHPWTYRFMILAAPWWAVTVAAGLEAWPRHVRSVGWLIMFLASVSVFWHVTIQTPQAGWLALTRPEPADKVHQEWRRWSNNLGPPATPLLVALELNRPLAAFLRFPAQRSVQLMELSSDSALTAEAVLAKTDRWLLTPLARFIGREGRVRAQTLIFADPLGAYSLAAYRPLMKGENPAAVLYRNQRADTEQHARRSLLIRLWDAEPVRLELFNPRSEPCGWLITAPGGNYQGEVPAGASAEVSLALPADSLAELIITFSCPPSGLAPVVALSAKARER